MIHINSFVRRQTDKSPFTHWTISDKELVERIEEGMAKAKQGYRPGVLLVPVNPEGFHSAVALLKEGDKLVGEYASRRAGEEPRKSCHKVGEKQPAKTVFVVLYSHDVLEENDENESEADWEVISINGSPTVDVLPAPMPPQTLIANHFQMSGGTSTKMSAEEFVNALRESVMYWKDKVQVLPAE